MNNGVQFDALTVTLIISFFIPVLTGLATKLSLSSGVKGLITLVLNAVNAVVVTAVVVDGSATFTQEVLVNFFLGLAISIAAYAGVYKPLDVTSSTPEGKLAPEAGLG